MATKMKVSKKITPKDKSKIKSKVSTVVSIRTDGTEIKRMSESKNVSRNKKYK